MENLKEVLFRKTLEFFEADKEMPTDYTAYGKTILLNIIAEAGLEKEFKEYEESKSE